MRCSITAVALLGLFVNASTAALCTLNNATPFEQIVAGGSTGSGSGSGSGSGRGGSGSGRGGSGSGSGSGGGGGGGVYIPPLSHVKSYLKRSDPQPTPIAAVPQPPLARRAGADSVQCTSAEVCAAIEDVIFCYNKATGDFHDAVGTTGNLFTGDYTMADGTSGNLYSDATATGTAAPAATTRAGGAATTGRAAATTAAGAANPTRAANEGASNGGLGSAVGGLMAVLFAGLF